MAPTSELARASRIVARQPAPGFRGDFVRRPRLVSRLREARSAALVLLTAPAGYGKTTLLAEWAAEDDRPFVWVTLVDADNDPALFAASATDALDEMKETVGEMPGPFVFVFDDVHVLRNRECLEALTVMIDHLPRGAQVALASRTEPALKLGRRRAHRGLAELKQRDLAMTPSEGGDLLARMGLKLSAADVATLLGRAEGWPVAVYLAGLSLRGQRDAGRAVARFAGADRLVVDYLRDEFLAGLSRRKLEFLTRTSVLDTLAGPICDAVLERSGSAQVLRNLARSNTLLVPLDRIDHAYRYHALFAEMLKSELRHQEPESERSLHRRASTWYAEHHDFAQAIEHGIAAGEVERAGELIWAKLSDYLNRGHLATVRSWLGRFADEQIATSPALCLAAAQVALANGDGALGEHWERIGLEGTGWCRTFSEQQIPHGRLCPGPSVAGPRRHSANGQGRCARRRVVAPRIPVARGVLPPSRHRGTPRRRPRARASMARRRRPQGCGRRAPGPGVLLGATRPGGDRAGRLERGRAIDGSCPSASRAIRARTLPLRRPRAGDLRLGRGPSGPCRRCAPRVAAIYPSA